MKSMRDLPKKYKFHILLHVWRMWDKLMLLNSQNASAQAKSRPRERGTFCTSKYSKIYSRISPVLANCVRKFAVPDDTWESSRCVGGWKKYQKIIEAINRPVSEASVAVCYRCREYWRKSSHTGRTSSPPLQPLTYVTFAFFPRETVSTVGLYTSPVRCFVVEHFSLFTPFLTPRRLKSFVKKKKRTFGRANSYKNIREESSSSSAEQYRNLSVNNTSIAEVFWCSNEVEFWSVAFGRRGKGGWGQAK